MAPIAEESPVPVSPFFVFVAPLWDNALTLSDVCTLVKKSKNER